MRRSRLNDHKKARLIEHFVTGGTARVSASIIGVNKSTAAYFFHRLREIIAKENDPYGWVENDCRFDSESCPVMAQHDFDNKIILLSIHKCMGDFRIVIFDKFHPKREVFPIFPKCTLGVVYYPKDQMSAAVNVNKLKLIRINRISESHPSKSHLDGLENFWNQCKRHLAKYNGIPAQNLGLFLKETEWRNSNKNPASLHKQLRKWAKKYL